MTLTEKLDSLTDKSAGDSACWPWKGRVDRSGYGRVCHNGRETGAHRAAWEAWNSRRVPQGLVVRHVCDNTSCVNPAHLKIGTVKDNCNDTMARGRTSHLPNAPKQVISDKGHSFVSVRKAAEYFNVDPATVRWSISNGLKINGAMLEFADKEDAKRGRVPPKPVVSTDGEKRFSSLYKLASHYCTRIAACTRAIKHGCYIGEKIWVYDTSPSRST